MRLRNVKLPAKTRRIAGNALTGGPAAVIHGESLTETLSPVELLIHDYATITALGETLSATDALVSSLDYAVTLAESAVLAETLSSGASFSLALAETVTGGGTVTSKTTVTAGILGAIQVLEDRTGTAALASGLVLSTSAAQAQAIAESLTTTLDMVVSLSEVVIATDTVGATTPVVTGALTETASVSDTFSETLDVAVSLAENAPASDQVSIPSVFEVSLDEFVTPVDGFTTDAGIIPEPVQPPVHFGGIGGPTRGAPLHGLAQGADLVIALVLEPGRVHAGLGAVAAGASLVGVVAKSEAVTKSVTVLGDSFHARITLDQGYAFGEKDWRRYNEEVLLLVA